MNPCPTMRCQELERVLGVRLDRCGRPPTVLPMRGDIQERLLAAGMVVPSPWPRRVVLGCAAVLLALGLFTGGLFVWEQWGSNWYTARIQRDLTAQLARSADDTPTVGVSGATSTSGAGALPVPVPLPQALPAPALGEPLVRITAPTADIDAVVVVGIGEDELTKGPGWMVETPLPGSPGNSVISGHRTTYGGPFGNLDLLEVGDRITITRPGSPDSVFEVRASFVVAPDDVWVTRHTDGVRLTLTTCHPKGSARQRLIVQAELVEGYAIAQALPAERWTQSAP